MISITQWNLNGYFNNHHELQLLIKKYSSDIICLQETHIKPSFNPYTPNKYVGYFHNLPHISNSKQGIAILIKKSLKHTCIHISSNISILAIKINIGFEFVLLNIYIPPCQSFSSSEINQILSQFSCPIVLVGDLNSWSPLWGSPTINTRGKILEDVILSTNLVVLNDGSPTHFTTHSTFTHVDISLCSSELATKCNWEILNDLSGSDHYPIILQINTGNIKQYSKPKPKFKLAEANWKKFSLVSEKILSLTESSLNINKEAARIQKCIISSAHHAIPQTIFRPLKHNVPWWNSEISSLRTEKQKSWSEFRKHRSTDLLIKYKKANALFRKKSKEAKLRAFEEFSESINPLSSPKKIWSDIKTLSGSNKSTPIKIIVQNNNVFSSTLEIANLFAKEWSNYSLDSNFSQLFLSEKQNYVSYEHIPNNISISAKHIEKPINLLEYDLVISNAKGKTPGADRISYPMLKNASTSLKLAIINLFNNILIQGIYPQFWKTALVLPIPKPNKNSTEINGYRPISLLSCVSKTLEKIIANRLMWYVEKNKLLSPNQMAFKKGQGTSDVLLHFDNFVTNSLSSRNHISTLALDFEKAFDRIGSHVVLRQLKKWNIGPKIYNLIKHFLSNRKFRVTIQNNTSAIVPLFNGIPQGSPLSVILFIIAFNEISVILSRHQHIKHTLYADDVLIFTKILDLNIVTNLFFEILNDLSHWSQTSGANIAYNKCCTFHICNKRYCNNIALSYNNVNIENVNTFKFLGVTFDSKYTFKTHCTLLRKSLAQRLNIIKYLSSKRCLIHPTTLLQVTRALILSKIDYGLHIYGKCANTHMKLLYAPYHAAIKRSLRAFPTTPIKNVLTEAGLPFIPDRVESVTLMLIPKLLLRPNEIISDDLNKLLKRKTTPRKQSTLSICAEFIKEHEIECRPRSAKQPPQPSWNLCEKSIVLDLAEYKKDETNHSTFQKTFLDLKNFYSEWNFFYTDGSKSSHSVSFAVVDDHSTLIHNGILEPYCSVFTAEATAILKAIEYVSNKRGKHMICTDSLSTLTNILNLSNRNILTSIIRTKLIQHRTKIKLLWIPGHVGISGNEVADLMAKSASTSPTYLSPHLEIKDLQNFIKIFLKEKHSASWMSYNHHYKNVNPSGIKAMFPKSAKIWQLKPLIRLRLGHIKATHEHLLTGLTQTTCFFCNQPPNSIQHILDDCPIFNNARSIYFPNQYPSHCLQYSNNDSYLNLYNFLQFTNILSSI